MKLFISKMRLRCVAKSLLGATAILAIGCASTHSPEKRARIVPDNAVIGEWAGFSDEHGFYLMRLEAGGSGLLGYMPYQGKPSLLRVNDWRCNEKRLSASVTPLNGNPKGIEKVGGPADWMTMTLEVSGSGWQRQVVFHREDDRVQREKALRDLMAAYTASGKTTEAKPK
jgi:hypothetical protein